MTVLSSLIAFSCAAIVLTPSIMSYASGTRWRRRNSTEANLAPQSFDENAVEEVLQRTRGTQRTADRKRWSTFEVVQLVRETANDVSVYMMPIDGKVPPTYRAGQHTMILRPAMGNLPAAQRCYTLSLAPGLGVWRITVRDAKATRDTNSVSRWVCNELKVGDRLSVRNPGGVFTLDLASDTKPLVLIGAGIGITPMSSMIQHELMFDRKRPKWLFHQVRDPASSPLTGEICELIERSKNAHAVIAYSQTLPEEPNGLRNTARLHQRLDGQAIINKVGTADASFFLCGPETWTVAITDSLKAYGVPESQIFSEGFGGPQSTHSNNAVATTGVDSATNSTAEIKGAVEFRVTGSKVAFTSKHKDLLSLAEANGIAIASGCRSGSCGTCAVRLLKGKVKYSKQPQCELNDDEILPCVCEPTEDISVQA